MMFWRLRSLSFEEGEKVCDLLGGQRVEESRWHDGSWERVQRGGVRAAHGFRDAAWHAYGEVIGRFTGDEAGEHVA